MNTPEFLLFCSQQGYTQENIKLFQKTIAFIEPILKNKTRLAGDTYFDHNLRVATILVENKAEPEIVIVGLLHGLLKEVPAQKIQQEFGESIFALVQSSASLRDVKVKNKKLAAEALRKIILTTLHDVRIILVKLAVKLDNLRSIQVLLKEEQKRIAEEVLEIYAPLASSLGLEKIKIQLEDFAFRVLNPQKYREIANYLEDSREQREATITSNIELIRKIAADHVKIVKIKGRPKNLYSIYKKIRDRNHRLEKQYDLLGIRIIVPTEKDCYTLLGLLHEHFEPLEGRLKDYIANPKQNLYRSIHTGLKTPGNHLLEIQIRTPEMDEFAEEGIAAHWRYKGIKSDQIFEKKIAWLRNVLDLQKNNKELLEEVKIDLFGDKISCYTPKGDVKELPVGATILDFAFLVHEQIGSHCVGARVNGQFVPLKHKLNAGDVVEILTNKNQRPRRSWIKLVVSGKARQKIRKSLKEHELLPAFHFRTLKPEVTEEQGLLVACLEYPKALCTLAQCCQALPDEPIVGLITKQRIISVHKKECRATQKEEVQIVKVQWKTTFNQKIHFFVNAEERSGLLADLLHTIATAGFEVKEAKAKLMGARMAHCSFLVIPRDLEQLKAMIQRVQKVKGVRGMHFA